MSRPLPAATFAAASTIRIRDTTSRSASACATAPPRSPAPRIETVAITNGRGHLVRPAGVFYWPMSTLTGKVAVVTGGARGIGLAIARDLLAQGGTVAITGTSQEHLSKAEKTLDG